MLIDQAAEMGKGEIVNASGQITDMQGLNEALFALIRERYAGAMEIQSTSWNGLISNAKDSMNMLVMTMSEPVFDYLKDQLASVVPVMSGFTAFMQGDMEKARKNLVDAFGEETANRMMETFEKIQNGIDSFREFLLDLAPVWENMKRIFASVQPLLVIVGGAIAVLWQVISEVLPPTLGFITGLAAAIMEWEGFVPIVLGLVGGFLAFKGAIAVVAGVSKAMAVMSKVIWGVRNAVFLLRYGLLLLNTAFLANPITWIVGLIIGLIAIFVTLYKTNEDFRNLVLRVWAAIKNAFASVIEWATTTVPQWWSTMLDGFSNFVDSIVAFFSALGTQIRDILQPFIDYFVNTWENLKLLVLGIIQVFISLVTGDFEGLKLGLLAIWTAIKRQAEAWWTFLKETVIKVIVGLWNGAVQLFKNGSNVVSQWVKDTYHNAVRWFTNMKDSAVEKIKQMWKGIVEWISGIPGKFKDMATAILEEIRKLDLKQAAKDMINGFLNGIDKMWDSVVKKAKEFAGWVEKGIRDRLQMKSPSRVTMELGVDTGLGYIGGLDKMIDEAKEKALDLANSVTDAMSNANATLHLGANLPTILRGQLGAYGGSMSLFDGIRSMTGNNEHHVHYWQINAEEISDVARLIEIVNGIVQTVRSR